MKLYATTTSERASKGQGGNERLEIEVLDEARRPILHLKLKPFGENGLVHAFIKKAGHQKALWAGYIGGETKSKREKGECKHFIVKDDYGKEYCQECGRYNNLS